MTNVNTELEEIWAKIHYDEINDDDFKEAIQAIIDTNMEQAKRETIYKITTDAMKLNDSGIPMVEALHEAFQSFASQLTEEKH